MDVLLARFGAALPSALEEQLHSRYDAHGMEYATEEFHIDENDERVPINACMTADTYRDIDEELVDAVFNCLVMSHKLEAERDYAKYQSMVAITHRLIRTWQQVKELSEGEEE